MDIEEGNYYHIFSRGNNSQKVFFKRENYLFFLNKLQENISPYASIIAWCLMPNQFHIVVFVHRVVSLKSNSRHPNSSRETTLDPGLPAQSSDDHTKASLITFNQSFGQLLSSYTRALQKQEQFTGSLFQKRSKAKPLIDEIKIEPAYWNMAFGTQINISEGKSNLETCIEYIHQNPVYEGLVKKAQEWEFSSFRDYAGTRQGTLIDFEMIRKENMIDETIRHPNSGRETIKEGGLPTQSSDDHYSVNTCIIGIGSNINAESNIAKMLEILRTEVKVIRVSPMIQTAPIGIKNQPDYTNGAVKIETDLDQEKLNTLLKTVEDQLGRDRTGPKFGPRTIDLDIAVWNGEIVDPDYYTRDFLEKSVKAVW